MPINNVFALEGPDGVGKTTVTKLVVAKLKADGRKTTTVRLPGHTPFGEAMREILLMRKDIPISPAVMAMAFTAVNVSVMEEVVRLSENSIVIMDRSQWSNYAYRTAEGMDQTLAMSFNQYLPFQADPLHSLLLDAPIEVLTARLKAARGDKPDRFEGRDAGFQQRVYDGYQALKNGGIVIPINANQEPEKVADIVFHHIIAHSTVGQAMQVFPQE